MEAFDRQGDDENPTPRKGEHIDGDARQTGQKRNGIDGYTFAYMQRAGLWIRRDS